ncbi:lysylphosphatidylglycerol synthase transmembrane domain-containing protein [Bosea sp. R86505]|uniref:lysylphosphatidylglycerol synthase transmembrane domain-containing protein n=1 Tax=Bosea sp. R86505 TaxID=3101710 RepID=UPI003672E4F7
MRILVNVARAAIAISMLGYLFSRIDLAEAFARAVNGDLVFIVSGTLVLAFQPLIGAIRWLVVLASNRSAVPLPLALRWTYIGVFFGQVLPATVGADALRIWYATRRALSLKNAVTSVMLDRVAMMLTLILLLCFGGTFLRRYVDGSMLTLALLAILGGGVAGLSAVIFGDRLPIRLYRFRLVRGIGHLARDAKSLLNSPRSALIVFGMCLLSYLTLMTSIYLFARGFGAESRFLDIIVLLPPVLAASMLPISIGGWGTRELAMVAALGTAGIAPETALLASLWLGLGSIVIALPGAFFFLTDRGSPGSIAAAAASVQQQSGA